VCLWNWCLALVYILCTTEIVWKLSRLLTVNIINENIYSHGTGSISTFSLQEHLVLISIIIFSSFFCCINTLVVLVELHHQTIPYLISECKYEQYVVFIASVPNTWGNLLITKQAVPNLRRRKSVLGFRMQTEKF